MQSIYLGSSVWVHEVAAIPLHKCHVPYTYFNQHEPTNFESNKYVVEIWTSWDWNHGV